MLIAKCAAFYIWLFQFDLTVDKNKELTEDDRYFCNYVMCVVLIRTFSLHLGRDYTFIWLIIYFTL